MIANSPFRKFHRKARKSSQRGMALVVILACVVLLTVMVMAYFSYSSLQRQISSSSANQTSANVFAIGAVNTVLGDLKQENRSRVEDYEFYGGGDDRDELFPATASAAIPALSGFATNNGLENLIKISRSGSNFFPDTYANASTFPPSSRAINLSTTNASKNGRYVSAEDWNRPLLLARQNSNSTSDDTPVASFVPPDWILVNRSGANPSNPTASSVQWTQDVSKTNTVIGRYAYAIYDEGDCSTPMSPAIQAAWPSPMQPTKMPRRTLILPASA